MNLIFKNKPMVNSLKINISPMGKHIFFFALYVRFYGTFMTESVFKLEILK